MKRVLLSIAAVAALAAAPSSALAWAPAASATIHPGVMTFTGADSFLNGAGQCTANFVYTDGSGNVYLGQAAHCSSTGGDTSTNGCTTGSLPLGTPIYAGSLVNGGIQPGTKIGTLAYNSWIAMQNRHETDPNTCAYNDLALIKIDSSQVGNVNPTVPFWGGPFGVATSPAPAGTAVTTYGNSILRGGIPVLSPKAGISLGDISGSGGWSQSVYTVTPGIPGDSGSGYMNTHGQAIGVLSTVELVPLAGSNGVGSLDKELAYANAATGAGYQIANGTSGFPSLSLRLG